MARAADRRWPGSMPCYLAEVQLPDMEGMAVAGSAARKLPVKMPSAAAMAIAINKLFIASS